MAFPSSPDVNDLYISESGTNFIWDGEKWITTQGGGANFVAGATGATGATGPEGTFSSGADVNIGTLTVDQVDIEADLNITDGTTTKYTFARTSGNFTAVGNVIAYSDITLKENIEEISDALEKVSAIRGVTYDRKDLDGARHAGVIAQEVEAVLPEVVVTNEEGIKTVAYGNLVGLLVEAIKELKDEVESLKGSN